MARNFPCKIKDAYPSVSCVYKVHFGPRFFIVKAKAFKQSIEQLTELIDRKLRLGVKPGDIHENIIKYIRQSRIVICTAEVIFQSDNHGALMDFENKILKDYQSDKLCLNTTFEAYQPKWMSQTQIDDFNKSKYTGLETETTAIKIKKTPVVTAPKIEVQPISATEIDLNDISDILDGISKINAAKDLKTRH